MALDVYVGPLTRYYAGDWENVGQMWARERGVGYQIIRPQDRSLLGRLRKRLTSIFPQISARPLNPERVRKQVLQWRQGLSAILPGVALGWAEEPDGQVFTDRPAWDGYGGLLLWAAYDEHPGLQSAEPAVTEWHNDPAFKASTALGAASRWAHLLTPEFWLPAGIAKPVRTRDIQNRDCVFGSSIRLLDELNTLNARTWQMDDEDLVDANRIGSPQKAELEASARFGFTVFHKLARLSVAHKLPMKLDY